MLDPIILLNGLWPLLQAGAVTLQPEHLAGGSAAIGGGGAIWYVIRRITSRMDRMEKRFDEHTNSDTRLSSKLDVLENNQNHIIEDIKEIKEWMRAH